MSTVQDKTVLVVGGGSGIGRRLAHDVVDSGGRVVLAGRHLETLTAAVAELGERASSVRIDLADEATIAAAAASLDAVDHLVVLAADHANGPVADLDAAAVEQAFRAKVIGPILLAKHFGATMPADGSIVLFSGIAAWKPSAGLVVMATTNGAVDFLARALAVELAPVRVNAVSPGIIDSGAWDGDGKQAMFDQVSASNPVGRVGTTEDVASAVMALLTNGFVTGETLHVDGGGRLA